MNELRTITLDWQGPFDSHSELPAEPGLYAVSSYMYGSVARQILYVGIAKKGLASRWTCAKHRNWLKRTVSSLDARLHCAVVGDTDREAIPDIETVLIYVHQPNQNSQDINSVLPAQRYIIHNTGNPPHGLLPVIDTAYPWFWLHGGSPAILSADTSMT